MQTVAPRGFRPPASHVRRCGAGLFVALALLLAPAVRARAAADSVAVAAPASTSIPMPRLSGYAQAREFWQKDAGLTMLLNRVRISVDGTLPSRFSYRLMTELQAVTGARTPATVSLREAVIRWSPAPFRLSAGEYKSPFTREFLIPTERLELADLAVAVDSLATRYDLGVMAEYALGATATFAVGAFNGEGANTTANRDSAALVVARATVRALPQLAFGASYASDGSDSLRWGVDARAEYTRALVRAEYVTRRSFWRDRTKDDFGWYVFESFRVVPHVQLLARQEDFQRPWYGSARRVRGLSWGGNWDIAPNRVRLIVEMSRRISGQQQAHADTYLAQVQAEF